MHGTWKTTGGSPVSGKWLAIGAALFVLILSGAAAKTIHAVTDLIYAIAVLVGVLVAGLAFFVVHRARHPNLVQVPAPTTLVQQLPTPERAALEPPAPRELHQHVHNDVHLYVGPGADPAEVAEIIRRSQRPE